MPETRRGKAGKQARLAPRPDRFERAARPQREEVVVERHVERAYERQAERPAVQYSRPGTWHAGLPAAAGEQMECPAGTMAVLARGHSSTFRCLPI